jgi:hypothetical protein
MTSGWLPYSLAQTYKHSFTTAWLPAYSLYLHLDPWRLTALLSCKSYLPSLPVRQSASRSAPP